MPRPKKIVTTEDLIAKLGEELEAIKAQYDEKKAEYDQAVEQLRKERVDKLVALIGKRNIDFDAIKRDINDGKYNIVKD